MSDLKLAYVDVVGLNSMGSYEYEFYFSENPDNVWGEKWNELCPSACGDMTPNMDDIHLVKRIITDTEINVAQRNNCFSMQDMIDQIIACAWFDDKMLETIRIFRFGMDYDEVVSLLDKSGMSFEMDKEEDDE